MSSEEAVRKWLVKTGYPLEMEVAIAFQRKNFDVSQSDFYVDPDTAEPREIDVTAEVSDLVGKSVHMNTFIINVECKKSTDKPWVLFLSSTEPNAVTPFRWYTDGNRVGRALVRRTAKNLVSIGLPLFHIERAAYGMTQSLRTNDSKDTCYQALMQVLRATQASVQTGDKDFKDLYGLADADPGSTDILLVFSVIVVDGELYVAALDKGTAELNVNKVDHQILLRKNPIGGVGGSIVHVVSRRAIDSFVRGAWETFSGWHKWCQQNLEAIDKVSKKEIQKLQSSIIPPSNP